MEHEWILDTSFYYEAGKYDDIDDYKSYICKNCNMFGQQNNINGEIGPFWMEDAKLNCGEYLIKNIIE